MNNMTTLIALYNSDGCIGRCDARCHDAHHDRCTCICGGKNHGVGLDQATKNMNELGEIWLEGFAEQRHRAEQQGKNLQLRLPLNINLLPT